jgi:hypothetical protein
MMPTFTQKAFVLVYERSRIYRVLSTLDKLHCRGFGAIGRAIGWLVSNNVRKL